MRDFAWRDRLGGAGICAYGSLRLRARSFAADFGCKTGGGCKKGGEDDAPDTDFKG